MIVDNFLDIIKHTAGLGFIELVKVEGRDKDVIISAMDPERSVVINGTLHSPLDNLEGVVGLSRISVLNGYLKFPPFSTSESSVDITKQKRHGSDVPCEIKFNSNDGHVAHYRFMSPEIVEETIRVPPFKGATWDIEITPSQTSLDDLSYLNSVLKSFEPLFTVQTTDDGDLNFLIGSGASDRTTLTFAKNIKGSLKHGWSWPINEVLTILKLHSTSEFCKMYFSDQGALKIKIDSGLGVYDYILPARTL